MVVAAGHTRQDRHVGRFPRLEGRRWRQALQEGTGPAAVGPGTYGAVSAGLTPDTLKDIRTEPG